MQFLHRHLVSDLRRHYRLRHQIRHIYDDAVSIERPSDRGLDHAVAREFNLRPLLNLKNHIISDPSNSLPYSQISHKKRALQLPVRAMEFIRAYPTVFEEVTPGSIGIQPDIKLTPEAVDLHNEDDLLYQSVDYKQGVACRLLKLLMINRVNKIPISLLERLKWDLGLPRDYEETIVPEFPDYFQVVRGKRTGEKEIELVFWSDEFAVSEMEKGAKDGEVQFPSHYLSMVKLDKKYEKWLDEWQKLPYVSPYENAMRLHVHSEESDRWAVGMLHEVLNLFVGRKVERESLLCLGEYLGLKSRFKLAIFQHPGIFYSSRKNRTKTIVLRDAYKRGALINRHALVDLTFKYVHLMYKKVLEEKLNEKADKSGTNVKKADKSGTNVKKDEVAGHEDSESEEEDGAVMDDSSEEEENGAVMYDSSEEDEDGAVVYDLSEEDEDDDYEDEDEGGSEVQRGKHKRDVNNFEEKNYRSVDRRSNGRRTQENKHGSSRGFSRRTGVQMDGYGPRRSREDSDNYGKDNRRGSFDRGSQRFEGKNVGRNVERRSNGRSTPENGYESSRRFSRRTDARSDGYGPKNPERISDFYVNGKGRSAMERGRSNRGYNKFGGKNVRSNVGRSSNEKYESESSTKLPRRNNVRGEPDVSTRSKDI